MNESGTYSLTQGGNIAAFVGVLMLVLKHYNVTIDESTVFTIIAGLVALGGVMTSWLGRYRQGDVTVGGWKK